MGVDRSCRGKKKNSNFVSDSTVALCRWVKCCHLDFCFFLLFIGHLIFLAVGWLVGRSVGRLVGRWLHDVSSRGWRRWLLSRPPASLLCSAGSVFCFCFVFFLRRDACLLFPFVPLLRPGIHPSIHPSPRPSVRLSSFRLSFLKTSPPPTG